MRHARATLLIGVLVLSALSSFAQTGPSLSPPTLGGSLTGIPTAPRPLDANGNPIPVPTLTNAERAEIERQRQADDARRLQKERDDEAAKRAEEAERQEADRRLAEEKSFHDRIVKAIYVGLAILAVFVASRFLKRD